MQVWNHCPSQDTGTFSSLEGSLVPLGSGSPFEGRRSPWIINLICVCVCVCVCIYTWDKAFYKLKVMLVHFRVLSERLCEGSGEIKEIGGNSFSRQLYKFLLFVVVGGGFNLPRIHWVGGLSLTAQSIIIRLSFKVYFCSHNSWFNNNAFLALYLLVLMSSRNLKAVPLLPMFRWGLWGTVTCDLDR